MEEQNLPVLVSPFHMVVANYNENLDQCLDRLYFMKQKLNRDFYTYFNGCLVTTEKSREENLRDYLPWGPHKCLLSTYDLDQAIDTIKGKKGDPGYVEYYASSATVKTPSNKIYQVPAEIINLDSRFLDGIPEDDRRAFISRRVEDSKKFGAFDFYQELKQRSEPDPDDNF